MFGHREQSLLTESLDISDLLNEVSEERYLAFQCFTETNNFSVLNETTIKEKFSQVIERIVKYIKNIVNKIMSFIDIKVRATENLIKKYKPKLDALTDEQLSELVYERVIYKTDSKVPIAVNTPIISNGIELLSSNKIKSTHVQKLRNQIDTQLPIIRGQMLGLTGPVSDVNFDDVLERTFKSSMPPHDSNLSRKDLNEIIKSIEDFKKDKSSIEESRKSVSDMLWRYKTQLDNVFSMQFVNNSSDVVIKLQSGEEYKVNVVDANYYREYQSLLTGLVIQIVNTYTTVFDMKVKMLKEKYERNLQILKEVIYLIDTP